jgi:hypothetical protein
VEINRVLDAAYNDTMTDYLGTLDAIHSDIQRDIRNAENQENLVRTKYIVVFLSDGMSNVQGGRQSDTEIWNRVTEIEEMALEMGVGSFNFHTFLLLGMFPPTAQGQTAQQLAETALQGMADRGNGHFSLFDNAESIDFINIVDMRLTVEFKIKYLVAYNYSVKPGIELVYVDSDGDGLLDEEELIHETDPVVPDTDNDGLSDFFEISVSSPGHELDPLTPDSPCDTWVDGEWPDSDDDGLTDCEEYVKGTNRHLVDTDNDGIPDGIEFRVGTNPLEIQYTTDSDFDGLEDWLEVQQHTNVTSNDPKNRQRYCYHYDIRDEGLVAIEQGSSMPSYVRLYQFDITNIDIMETLANEADLEGDDEPSNGETWSAGDNIIRFFIAEVPEDNPEAPPIFRVADIVVNYHNSNRDVVLTPTDFELMQ